MGVGCGETETETGRCNRARVWGRREGWIKGMRDGEGLRRDLYLYISLLIYNLIGTLLDQQVKNGI